MICFFCNKEHKVVRTENLIPQCGEDFCDICGDCLYCYGGDPCWEYGEEDKRGHRWVVYINDIEDMTLEEFIESRK